MLEGLDALIYDLQDGGVRFYTYASTLVYTLQAGAEHALPVIVLDRPNPISGVTPEGPLLDPDYTSFVGMIPTPIRHSLTAGELALFCNDVFGIGCDVTVVQVAGWRRELWFDQTGLPFVQPSPNLPTLSSLTVYPGTCLVEGTNLSEGRGTTRPFEYIGAPWLDGEWLAQALNALSLPGVRFRPAYFVPTFSKYQGELCGGVQFHVLDRTSFRPVDVALHLIALVKGRYPEAFGWRAPWTEGGHYPIDLLAGGSRDLGASGCWKPCLRACGRLGAGTAALRGHAPLLPAVPGLADYAFKEAALFPVRHFQRRPHLSSGLRRSRALCSSSGVAA